MVRICETCNQKIKEAVKTQKIVSPDGYQLIVKDMPLQNCGCYGDTVAMQDAAMVEAFAKDIEEDTEITFDRLKALFAGKNLMELVDPGKKFSKLR